MKKFLLLVCLCCFSLATFAQDAVDLLAKNRVEYGATLYKCHKISEAINEFNMAIECCENEYLPYCYAYLYKCYVAVGKMEDAEKYAGLLRESMKTFSGAEDEQYSICLTVYGDILRDAGDYQNAMIAYERALTIDCALYGDESSRTIPTIYRIGCLCLDLGEFNCAESYAEKMIGIVGGTSDLLDEYILAITLKAGILQKKGRLGEAIALLETSVELADSITDEETKLGFYTLLTDLYGEIGEFQKSLKYELQALNYYAQHYGTESPDYATSILNLSEVYGVLGEKKKSMELTQEAVDLFEKLYGRNSKEYYVALRKLADRFVEIDIDKAISTYWQALHYAEELFGEESYEYANCLIYTASCKVSLSNDKEDLSDFARGLEIIRKTGRDNDVYYFSNLSLLGTYYYYFRDLEAAYKLHEEYYTKIKQYVVENFQNLIEWQRESIWDTLQQPLESIPALAFDLFSPRSQKMAYNSLLLRKGLLLMSANSISRVAANSGNADLQALHDEINRDKEALHRMASHDDYERKQDEISVKQRKEIEEIKRLGIITDFLNVDWTDVRNALKEGEAAIEFCSYLDRDDHTSYGALVLKSNSTSPELIPLFNDGEEVMVEYKRAEKKKYDYDNPELYRFIWERLEKYSLKGINTIYFAPDGILNVMPIEHLMDKNGVRASDKWLLYRLSSTREIVDRPSKSVYANAVLYGGLNYKMEMDDLIAESRNSNPHTTVAQRSGELTNLRGGVKYLPGTKEEVEKIVDLLDSAQIEHQTFMGNAGTEESFRSLFGDINIIHLATHGFFWSGKEVRENRHANFLSTIALQQRDEDNALLRSAIVFSGANIGLNGDDLPDDVEDGVLTAQELSALNLGDVDLVVLSACQSGLGEISPEGVFGLQRGFKLAGAKSLLMSLWEVDDNATQMLMIEFYRNLLNGESKTVALHKAQQYVQSQSEKYANPYFWAGFILLDAMN